MPVSIGNAPCSWGVEFADAPSNPPWQVVLDETSSAGYAGTELGPIGYMPEDASLLQRHLDARSLALTAGVVFRPFHDGAAWDELQDALRRTCRTLAALGAKQLVFIDSISPARSACAAIRAPRRASTLPNLRHCTSGCESPPGSDGMSTVSSPPCTSTPADSSNSRMSSTKRWARLTRTCSESALTPATVFTQALIRPLSCGAFPDGFAMCISRISTPRSFGL